MADRPKSHPAHPLYYPAGDADQQASENPADWDSLVNVPSEFPPEAHTHVKAEITDFAHTLDSHSNVDTAGKGDGDILVWNAGDSEWQPADPGGVGGGTTFAREDVVITTASMLENAIEEADIDMLWKSANLLKIDSDREGFITFYATAAARTADVRVFPPTDDPAAGEGILGEFAFGSGGGTIQVAPLVFLYNDDGTPATDLYYRYISLEPITGATTLTLTILGIEA